MGSTKPLLLAAVLLGIAVGIGSYTFVYAKGASYLTNDPTACANCHVMSEHYSAWMKSSHRSVAVCNDCHTPPGSVFGKYATKATNGFWHSFYFTTGWYPEHIRIRESNVRVTEKACRKCHEPIVEAIEAAAHADGSGEGEGELSCLQCHADVGHWVQ